MRTNVDLDDTLMNEARRVSGLVTKKATIEEALRVMIRLRGQKDILALAGQVTWTGDLAASREGRGTP